MKLIALLLLLSLPALADQRAATHFNGLQLMTVARRDRLHYTVPVAVTRATLPAVPFYVHVVEFELPEPVNALGVQETTDLINWRVVCEDAPHLWIGLGHKRITFTTPNQNAYWRAYVRNEP